MWRGPHSPKVDEENGVCGGPVLTLRMDFCSEGPGGVSPRAFTEYECTFAVTDGDGAVPVRTCLYLFPPTPTVIA
jgi:hypothetical protein